MEPPAKRARIGGLFLRDDEDADDELFLDPSQVNAQRDPAVILEQSRELATFKLKSRWEDVFKKFEKDFTDEGDIINFYTDELPEVEVDNGHLRSLEDADDGKSVAASESADLDEEERILHGNGSGGGGAQLIRAGPSSIMPRPSFGGRLSGLASLAAGPPRLSTMFSPGPQYPSFSSISHLNTFSKPIESIWKAPELPVEAFNNHALATKPVTRRRVAVKALPAAEDDSADEDDIIMGIASPWMQNKEKEKDQPVTPQVAPPDTVPVEETNVHEEPTPVPVQAPEIVQEVVARPERRKAGRRKSKPQEPRPAVEDEPPQGTAPEPSHITQSNSDAQPTTIPEIIHTVQTAINEQEAAGQPRRRTPRRPKGTLNEHSPVVAQVLPDEAIHEPPHLPENESDLQEVAKLPERRKLGRPRKHPIVAAPPAQEAALTGQSETTVIADSDAELLSSPPAVAIDVDGPDNANDDTSSAEPSSIRAVRIEVRLLRRRRIEVVVPQEVSVIPLLATPPAVEKEQSQDKPATVPAAKRKSPAKKRRRTLPPPPAIPSLTEDQLDDSRRQSLPNLELGTPAKLSPARPRRRDEIVVVEQQDQPARGEAPEEMQPATKLAKKPVKPTELFSRNATDKAYDFSDEDVSWVPPSRVKKTAKQIKKPSSTPRRDLVKRRPKASTYLGSSPSIRAAFPTVTKSFRTTRAKAHEDVLATPEQAESVEVAPPDDVPPLVSDDALEVDDSVAKEPEHPEPASPSVDQVSPSPLAAIRKLRKDKVPTTPSSHATRELVTPSSRKRKSKPTTATPSTTRPSTSKRSILSLLSDSDEDELSLLLDQTSPLVRSSAHKQHSALPIRNRSNTANNRPAVKRMSLSAYAKATPQYKKSRLGDAGGWKSASTSRVAQRTINDAVEDGDVHRTPGGTLRRCGEDGFKCERDFCFACL